VGLDLHVHYVTEEELISEQALHCV